MRILMRTSTLLLLLSVAVCAGALPFDTVQGGARGAAMSGMFSLTDESASAVFGNPARLADLDRASAQVMTRDWFGSGLRSWSAAYARPLDDFGVGLGWHRFGMNDLWTEDAITFTGAWRAPACPYTGITAHFGGGAKVLQVAVPGYEGPDYQGDFRFWSVDVACLATRGPFTFAWVEENLACGDMALIETGVRYRGTPHKRRGGLSYRWRDDLVLGCEYRERDDFDAELNVGLELFFFDAFCVRGGGSEHHASAGFGLKADRWEADGAFESRGKLGTSLIFSFTWKLGTEGGAR